MSRIQLVVFDMAGTTIRDDHEVEQCILKAAISTGLDVSKDRLHQMNGIQKRRIFELLWADEVGTAHPDYDGKVDHSYAVFRRILEDHYRSQPILPAEGAVEVMQWLRSKGIKVALNTGFYREVADIILTRLGWVGMLVDLSVTPTETGERGRPHPDMILLAMRMLGIDDPQTVVKVGDVPVDVEEGKAAGCLLSLAVTNGVGTPEELRAARPDGLLPSTGALQGFLEERGLV